MSAEPGVPLRYLARINPPTPEIARLRPEERISHLPLAAIWPDGELDLTQEVSAGAARGSYTVVREGDIVFPKVTPSFEHNRVAVLGGLVNGFAAASTEVHVVRPLRPELTELLQYRLRAADFQARGRAEMLGVAGLRRVPEWVVGSLRVPTGSIERRAEIVDFLNRRVAGIALLRQQLAGLLPKVAEARLALLEDAVGAAGPSAPLWSASDPDRPIMYGIVLPGNEAAGGVPLVKAGDVHRDRLRLDQLSHTSPEIDRKHARSRLRAGDVLLTIRGSVGDTAVVPAELEGANITQDTARITPRGGVSCRWLDLVLQAPSVQAQLALLTSGASIKGVTIRDLKKVRVPLPASADQERILASVEPRLAELDRLAERAERMRDLALEYRDSVITERVLDRQPQGARYAGKKPPASRPTLSLA